MMPWSLSYTRTRTYPDNSTQSVSHTFEVGRSKGTASSPSQPVIDAEPVNNTPAVTAHTPPRAITSSTTLPLADSGLIVDGEVIADGLIGSPGGTRALEHYVGGLKAFSEQITTSTTAMDQLPLPQRLPTDHVGLIVRRSEAQRPNFELHHTEVRTVDKGYANITVSGLDWSVSRTTYTIYS